MRSLHLILSKVLRLRGSIACPTALALALLGALSAPATADTEILVPTDVATLAAAITAVPDGGTIVLEPGTYTAPANGFRIVDPRKDFTIRAESAGTAVLDGANAQPVLVYIDNVAAQPSHVTFEGLTFRRGRSTSNGIAGGVSVVEGQVTFVDCLFEDNVSAAPTTGGGGVGLFTGAHGIFLDCVFDGNAADNEGGGLRVGASEAWVHRSVFTANRTNLAGHRPSASGGGIHMTDGILRVANSRFESNETAFAGGAIYALGTWQEPTSVPQAIVHVANSTFVDNVAVPFPGINTPSPTEGGAIHIEDQTALDVTFSRFDTNRAEFGGAVSSYRGKSTIEDSVFRGNRVTGTQLRGGTLHMSSNDTGGDGGNNRPSVELTVRDSLIIGRFGGVGTVGRLGGGLFASGDTNRGFGLGGVTPQGTDAVNRARIVLDTVVFADLDVTDDTAGLGGGVGVTFTDLTVTDSMFVGCDASGPSSQGGALRLVTKSVANVTGTTFASNTSEQFGGAIYSQGSDLDVTSSKFFGNEVSPGVSEGVNASFGAAIYSAGQTFQGQLMNQTGAIASSLFAEQIGLPIHEGDSNDEPINDQRFNGNTIYNETFGTDIYKNTLTVPQTVAELNPLVINRSSAPNTAKSQTNNTAPGSPPVDGVIVPVPGGVVMAAAAGDAATASTAYVAYAWTGGAATLDGGTVTGGWGVTQVGQGVHTLEVGAESFDATVANEPEPAATLVATPASISSGEMSQLTWSVTPTGAPFVDSTLDHGLATGGAAAGSLFVIPPETEVYTVCAITAQGGATARTTVFVDEVAGLVFLDGFESGNLSAWSSVVQ
ncbi:MAG: right-handed parallel beta-helix repeat-containing protein [Acidobacteriota bacterium]